MRRRRLFLLTLASAASLLHASLVGAALAEEPATRPNILWLSSEDNGPHLGAYGDAYATTPNLDRLAARGLLYLHAWANAPVCAPSRTAIISSLDPTATGSEHMRSMARLPPSFRMFPQLLREAGYYVTNNAKEDYNLEQPGQVWDDSSPRAHWRNRPPGAPFFAVFNIETTHESQIRLRPHTAVHDPASVPLPAYVPDVPEVRRDRAQYYDQLSEMDRVVGARLAELEADGLADSTIVFYWADHGAGLPREKRTPLDTGLRVPLVVSIPSRFRQLAPADYQPGGRSDRLVALIDLGPTVLSLAGVEPPSYFQGQAFLGPFAAAPASYLHGFRGRMDERYDLVRSVRDGRFLYARNYLPHLVYGQHVAYMFQTPTTQVWHELHRQGRLPPEQDFFWAEKPSEELYDLEQDPDQIRNLASSSEHRDVLARLRAALRAHLLEVRDVGFLPETEIHSRAQGSTPWEYGHSAAYPLAEILDLAELASDRGRDSRVDSATLVEGLRHPDSAARCWAVIGLRVRGEGAVLGARAALGVALEDSSSSVRIAAAEALARFGDEAERARALAVLIDAASLERYPLWDVLPALNALDGLDRRASSVAPAVAELPRERPGIPPLFRSYVPNLLDEILAGLQR